MSHPGWLLELVGEVLEYEDLHARDADKCFAQAAANVPENVRIAAETYMEYVVNPARRSND